MLEIDKNNNERSVDVDSDSQQWLTNPKAVPTEITLKYVFQSQGYLYTKVDDLTVSVARLVYQHHNPDEFLEHKQPIYHIDGDKQNNQIENLSPFRRG